MTSQPPIQKEQQETNTPALGLYWETLNNWVEASAQ